MAAGFTEPVSLALLSRLAQQEPAAAPVEELVAGLEAWQRAAGFVVSRMWLQVAELHTRFTGPVRARLEAAHAAGDRSAAEEAADGLDLAERSVCAEIGAALGWSIARTQGQLEVALILTGDLTATLDAVASGRLEVSKAEALARALRRESSELRRLVEGEVLADAPGWTVPELRDRVTRALLRAAPELAAERAVAARRQRRVGFHPEKDDMIRLEAVMSVLDGVRVRAALDHAALGIKAGQPAAAGDSAGVDGDGIDRRNLDQIRCDLLADTLIALGQPDPRAAHPVTAAETPGSGAAGSGPAGSGPGGACASGTGMNGSGTSSSGSASTGGRTKRSLREEVVLTVSFETITGDADEPGYLARYGPVSAATARSMAWEVARDGYWRCAVTDDQHGTLLGLGRTTFTPNYRPPEYLQRFVNLRDQVCDFPICRVPAAACDFEHTVAHPEGSTCECGGAKRCRSHHRLKHETAWSVKRSDDPEHPPGTHVWTSPIGREYASPPAVVGVPRSGATRPEMVEPEAPGSASAGSASAARPDPRLWAYDPALPDLPVPTKSLGKKRDQDPGPPPF